MPPSSPGMRRAVTTASRIVAMGSLLGLGFLLGLALAWGGLGVAWAGSTASAAGDTNSVVHTASDASRQTTLASRVGDPRAQGIPLGALPLYEPALLRVVTQGELERGETLATALRNQGIASTVVHLVATEMRPVYDFRNAQPGDRYRLSQAADGRVLDFRYSGGPEVSYHLFRDGERYVARAETVPLRPRSARIAGVVETSLYQAIRQLGEDPLLASDFADLFAWDIDFTRSVRPGDEFRILYQRLYAVDLDGSETYVRPGRILAARYRGSDGDHNAVYFEPREGQAGYFRADGTALEREFLVAPLQYDRITSRYSQARRHPILKVTRPHHGIDYAAPSGTPVWSVSDGTVIYRGWGGGFGNLVKVRHANGYVSYYSHLSRFAEDLRVGQDVSQKQVIGFVGSSGLSTGPHVCFRVAKDGHYVNPLRLRSPAGEPVTGPKRVEFQIARDTLLAELEGTTLVATDEAL